MQQHLLGARLSQSDMDETSGRYSPSIYRRRATRSVYKERVLPSKLHLFHPGCLAYISPLFVRTEEIVETSRYNANGELLGSAYNNEVPQMLPSAMLRVVVTRFRRAVLPSDQEPHTFLGINTFSSYGFSGRIAAATLPTHVSYSARY